MKRYFTRNNIEVLIFCIVLLSVWQGIAININNDIYLPKIEQVLNSLREILNQKKFLLKYRYDYFKNQYKFCYIYDYGYSNGSFILFKQNF